MFLPPRTDGFSVIRNSRNEPGHFWNRRPATRSGDEQPHRLTAGVSQTVSALLILVIAAVCIFESTPSAAQAVYGSIFGTVTDRSGAAVVGAKLTVTSVQKGTKFETTSSAAGNYNVTHLIPDRYDVRSQAPGFNVVDSTDIPVYADQAARVDIQLQVGGN